MPQRLISREEKLAGDRRRSQAYRFRQRAKLADLQAAVARVNGGSFQVDIDPPILQGQCTTLRRAITEEERRAGNRRRQEVFRAKQRAQRAADLQAVAVDNDTIQLEDDQLEDDPLILQDRSTMPRRPMTDEERKAANRRQQQLCRARKRAQRAADLQAIAVDNESVQFDLDPPIPQDRSIMPRRSKTDEERKAVNRRRQQQCRARKRAQRAADLQAIAIHDDNHIQHDVDPPVSQSQSLTFRPSTSDEERRAVNRRRQQIFRAKIRAEKIADLQANAVHDENPIQPDDNPPIRQARSLIPRPATSDDERRAVNRRRQQVCRAKKRAKKMAELQAMAININPAIQLDVDLNTRNPLAITPRTSDNVPDATATQRDIYASITKIGIGNHPTRFAATGIGGEMGDPRSSSLGRALNDDDDDDNDGTSQQEGSAQQQGNTQNVDIDDGFAGGGEEADAEYEEIGEDDADGADDDDEAPARALQSEDEPAAALLVRLEQQWGASKQQLGMFTREMQQQEQQWRSNKQHLQILTRQMQQQEEVLRRLVANTKKTTRT